MFVESNSESTAAWKVSRRFREFDALSAALRTHASCADLPLLPPKTMFNSSDVIAARRPQLDAFLSAICRKPALLSHGCVRAFLNLKVKPDGNVRHFNIEQIAVWVHHTPSPAVARLMLVHGLGEHSGVYTDHFIPAMTAANVEVVRFDLRGHGASHGERMYIEDFKDYVDDGDVVWNWALQELHPLPSYIMGHSMGGCISTYLASRIINGGLGISAQTDPKSLKGLILSAPAFEVGSAVSQVKIAAGRMINLLSPHTQLAGGIDRSTLSRAPGVAEAFAADPLCCDFNTVILYCFFRLFVCALWRHVAEPKSCGQVRQGTEILDAMKVMSVSAQKIT